MSVFQNSTTIGFKKEISSKSSWLWKQISSLEYSCKKNRTCLTAAGGRSSKPVTATILVPAPTLASTSAVASALSPTSTPF